MKSFFLIVGSGRNGSTLLEQILNYHPNVFVAHETRYYSYILKNNNIKNKSVNQIFVLLNNYWWIREYKIQFEVFERIFNELNISRIEDKVFFSLILSSSQNSNISVYGEKTPRHFLDASYLMKNYSFKVIHIVRDPRDVLSSYLSQPFGPSSSFEVADLFKQVLVEHKKNNKSNRYLVVKYEDLVSKMEFTLNTICDFLEIPYSKSLLKFYTRKEKGFNKVQAHHYKTTLPVTNSSVNKWRSKLNYLQIAYIEVKLKSFFEEFNYKSSLTEVFKPTLKLFHIYSFLSGFLNKIFFRKLRSFIIRLKNV